MTPLPDATRTDDEDFRALLRAWITQFHGQIRPQSDRDIAGRVDSYVRQEEQYREKVRFLLHTLARRGVHPQTVLDLGSGAGGLSVALAQAGLDVQGVEPSAAGVAAAQMRARRCGVATASFQVGVGESLPFGDQCLDGIPQQARPL